MSIKKSYFISFTVAIVVSLIPILELWQTNTVYSGSDLQFHLNRIHELVNQLKVGNLSLISYSSFNSVGSGVQYFYPSLTLAPVILVFMLIKSSILAYYVSLFLYGLITFFITYYAFSKIIKDFELSILGSIVFSLSTYRIFSIIGTSAFGEFIAISWIPLVLLGYYRIINREGWRTLWISLLLVGYTHLLTLLLTMVILVIVTIIRFFKNYQKVSGEVLSYIKVIIGFSLSFAAFLVPFLTLYRQNSIVSPDVILHYQWSQTFAGYYMSSFRLLMTRTLGFVFVVELLGMFFLWQKLTKNTRIIFWAGLAITFLASSDFLWYKLEHTAVAQIQFPYRFIPFAVVLLTFSGVLAIKDITATLRSKNAKKIMVICLGFLSMSTALVSIHEYKKQIDVTYKIEKTINGHLNYNPFAEYRVSNATFYKQYNNHFDTYGAFDYWTTTAKKNRKTITDHKILDEQEKPLSSYTKRTKTGINYSVENDKNQRLDLPFIKYNGVPYKVTVNGKKVLQNMSYRGTLSIYANKGNLKINVTPNMRFETLIFWGISMIASLIIIIYPLNVWKNYS